VGSAWLTPNTAPGAVASRCLFIPDDPEWLAIVAGALITLTFPHNFEQYGTATPQETADVFVEMFDNFSFNVGVCRVIGEIVSVANSSNPNPTNWLLCDGSSLLRTDYAELFSAIGTAFGSADGTHFNIPDLRGRTVVGVGTGAGLSARALGDSFGEETHILITSEVPSHSHNDAGHSHSEGIASPSVGAAITGVPVPSAIPAVGVTGVGFASIGTSGGDGSHNNLQPSLALNYYIVAL
jgi:microcystin-dependent protein